MGRSRFNKAKPWNSRRGTNHDEDQQTPGLSMNEIQFWLFMFFGFAWIVGNAALAFLAAKAEGALSPVVLKVNGWRWLLSAKTARGKCLRNLCLAWFFTGLAIWLGILLIATFTGAHPP